jgi:signal transduction histidine kinase
MPRQSHPSEDQPANAPPPPIAARPRLWSVGGKLAGATIALFVLVTLGIYLKLSRYQRDNLLQAKEVGASALTRLFADSCAAPVVFDDAAALRESLATLGHNQEVEYAAVWAVESPGQGNGGGKVGRLLAELRRGEPELVTEVPRAMSLRRDAHRVVPVAPIHNVTGVTVAVAVAAFSLAREEHVIANVERTTLLVSSGVALGLTLLLMAMARLLIVGPLGKLVVAAKQLEEGGNAKIEVSSNDEVGQLAVAFRSMAAAITVREERINNRNRDMRLLLDNVGQGFITLDMDGGMSEERSRVVDVWFGAASASSKFWEYLGRIDPIVGEWFEVGWGAIQDNLMPLSLCLEQLPKVIHKDERTFELAYQPITKGERIDKIIVVITETTARVEGERAERRQREMLSIFRRLLSDRTAFEEFFAEAAALVQAIVVDRGADLSLLKRQVHTLKGNCALFGIDSISECCHLLENRLNESAGPLSSDDQARLRALWADVEEMRAELIDDGAKARVDVDRADFQGLLDDLRRGVAYDTLFRTVTTWEYEPASKRLALMAEQVQRLAVRLRRAPVDVVREPTTLRLPPHKWGRFWSVIAHVIRNTVDHGVETAEERAKAGKPAQARVILAIAREDHRVVVSIEDDGRGIDWARIAESARHRGLPCETRFQLQEALFADGISSSMDVTSTSGRGVGLFAARALVRELGGDVEIRTERGRGTTVRCILPEAMLVDDSSQDGKPELVPFTQAWSRPYTSEKA